MTQFTRNGLTAESKAQLRKTVRGLRESLIAQLKESAEQRYLLSVPAAKAAATLDAATRERRRRLEAALDQAALEDGGGKEARARAFDAAAKEAGATLLNRLVLIRHLEALGLSKPAVLTGGWMSKGYREFQQVAAALCEDETQGMAPLLDLLFAELATALPGLFGDVGLTGLLTVPAATLRQVIEALDEIPVAAWCDDLTLGWVYQFWNDPDREALDAKINASGKIEPHEIASKTQMFTERYMVEWLLQNSLGPTWLAMCKKAGWTAEVESSGVLAQLDARRAEWRKKREAGEVAADALMPTSGPLEEAWKYYVPQPMPAAVVEHAPASLKDLKLLDPACGSGHFLVVAFDLLVELYREEARHRGTSWSDRQIAEWILEKNLHGIDIDPRAVQIAAAALYLKARALAKEADPRQVNLVAPMLKLSSLAKDDPGLVRLETDIHRETGIPAELTRQLIATLEGVDHLGSLLKVGDAIDKALEAHEGALARSAGQADFFQATRTPDPKPLNREAAKQIIRKRLEGFLAKHAGAEDLGLRLRGQQLTAGLRFASIVKEGEYDLVVGNPPYQGTSKMKNASYVVANYPLGRNDLYAAFLERGLQLCRPGGASAMVTMRSWMFLSSFTSLRAHLLGAHDLRALGDVGWGAFAEMTDNPVVLSVFANAQPIGGSGFSSAICPTHPTERNRTDLHYFMTIAGLQCQVGRHEFSPEEFAAIDGQPVVYWWSHERIAEYASLPKLGSIAPVRYGLSTQNNTRWLRKAWEVAPAHVMLRRFSEPKGWDGSPWVPYIKGSEGRKWCDAVSDVVLWRAKGLELATYPDNRYGRSTDFYFIQGVAFVNIGTAFSARAHRMQSIFGHVAGSVFGMRVADAVCLLNSRRAGETMESLNPGLHFLTSDVLRLPAFATPNADEIFGEVERAFEVREAGREASVEFRRPASSSWESVQAWAQRAVDRVPGERLPELRLDVDKPAPYAELSFQVGVAIGRFGEKGEGVQAEASPDALSHGLLFVGPADFADSLSQHACESLQAEWTSFDGAAGKSLRDWLRADFFSIHREIYENRPIYFPLASSKRAFVAYISIHRWTAPTLANLLSEYLIPTRKALEGSLADLRTSRATADKKSRSENDRLFTQQSKWLEELEDFIAKVVQCAEKGPPPTDSNAPAREVDAPYVMDLDDGVMVNAAALWPLLEPMWKDPKKWWKELATAKGRKDYDWSHLAARYFPSRVDEKCQKDPSLAVAHGCFWKYHPEVAYQWELRLQDEIGPDFLITEKDSDAVRKAFVKKSSTRAAEIEAAEKLRRERKANKKDQEDLDLETDTESSDEEDAA